MRRALLAARDELGVDLLVASGGISVGDHDLVLPALEGLGFELGFRRLRLRPGRPTTFGLLPRSSDASERPLPVLALPGNPASTFVTFELFARPLIRALAGLPERAWSRPTRVVELAEPTRGSPRRTHYVRARWTEDGRAAPLSKQLSGALRSIAYADLLLHVPEDRGEVPAGERLSAVILRE
ncbi:molybdopterin-binding protein [Plesiocystis pacifica]|uniref:molybdopterin-binding protein n=1 Tax=Plesiocystis pacifica TaxID=191768 RepID=UPI000A30F5C0|nr:molybdopterin-binding protein [Plesiocystis pacifica]